MPSTGESREAAAPGFARSCTVRALPAPRTIGRVVASVSEWPERSPSTRMRCTGDFKAANILFSGDGQRCAAYDFQYVGESYGVRDLVMLLHSSLQRTVVGAEADILRHYHSVLTSKLGTHCVLCRARNASTAHVTLWDCS